MESARQKAQRRYTTALRRATASIKTPARHASDVFYGDGDRPLERQLPGLPQPTADVESERAPMSEHRSRALAKKSTWASARSTHARTQPLLLVGAISCPWQAQPLTLTRPAVFAGGRGIPAGACLTPDRSATAARRCPNTPESDSWLHLQAASPRPGVHATWKSPPGATDGPFGVGSERGITTCTRPTAAGVAVQPRVLPGARPVVAIPLDAGGR